MCVFLFFFVVDLREIASGLPRQQFGDEWRYLYYAKNLLAGHYSPPGRVFLWNGPGYPLLLVPFVRADWLDGARYLNALFHAGAMVYAWLILRPRMPALWALAGVAALGFYPAGREHLPLIYTELFCAFLSTGWIFHGAKAVRSKAHLVASGVMLGMLTLTKVIFGPALLAFVAVLGVMWLRRRRTLYWAHVRIAALALVVCVPYLIYTFSLTGRVFYWASAWPNTFYWLTSPYPEELGDWYHQGWVFNHPVLREHHAEIFLRTSGLSHDPNLPEVEQLLNLSSPESADIFLRRALQNVREHPLKFVQNWLLNWPRLFFDVPVSFRNTPFWNEYTRGHLPLLLGTSFLFGFALKTRQRLPPLWQPFAVLMLLTLGAYSLSSIVARYLVPIVPIWWLLGCVWLAACVRAWRRGRTPRTDTGTLPAKRS